MSSFLTSLAYADVSGDLGHFFNSLGYSSNVTNPSVYQGQQAGFYTGGSLFLRNQVKNVQAASLTLPGARAGCSGIDAWTGGFSFIKGAQVEKVLKNVSSSAASYAFMLGVQSMLPQEANIMKYLETLQNKINQTNINTCSTAAGLVGGLWPKTQAAEKQVCQTIGTSKGLFSDWASARQGCGAGGQQGQAFSRGEGDDQFKNMLLGKGNLVWSALMQNSLTSGDKQLAELMMNLSGTIIIDRKGDTPVPRYIPSQAGSQGLVKALLHGGSLTILGCDTFDEKGCLKPHSMTITINQSDALANHVQILLEDMVAKIQTDTALTKEEIGLLNATRLPIYKMLNVQAALHQGQAVDVTTYSDLIATEILYQYLDESLSLVAESAHQLNWPMGIMKSFMQGLDRARSEVKSQTKSAWQQVATTSQLISQTEISERTLAGYLSSNLSEQLNWAGGIH